MTCTIVNNQTRVVWKKKQVKEDVLGTFSVNDSERNAPDRLRNVERRFSREFVERIFQIG